MQSGSIRVATHDGHYIIRLEGDVRLTLCTAFDAFIRLMFDDRRLATVLVDCTAVSNMDSTTLGQLARMALGVQQRGVRPLLFCPDDNLRRLVESMGFEDIFLIEARAAGAVGDLQPLPGCEGADAEVRQRVIEAHRTLMDLNEQNRLAFTELVKSLENND